MKRWAEDERAPASVRALLDGAAEATAEAPPFARARVFERVKPRARTSRAWIAAPVLAVALAIFVWMPVRTEVGTVVRVVGDVHVETRPDGTLARAVSEAGGTIELASLGTLELVPETEIRRRAGDASAWRFEVARGALRSDVPQVARVGGYAVIAAEHEVRVVGTRFSVARGPEDVVTVEVTEGVLRVEAPGVDRRVEAPGRYVSASAVTAGNASVREVVTGDSARAHANAWWPDESVADREERLAVRADGEARRAVRGGGEDRPAVRADREDRLAVHADGEERRASLGPPVDEPADASTARADDAPASPEVAMAAYRAALEAPPEQAARRLVVVAETYPAVRELALHRAARLLKDAGECGAALPRYEALLDEFSEGGLDLERRLDRAECLRATGRNVALAAALDDLEGRDLDRARRAELALMRADLARRRGDLEGVLRVVRAVPTDVPAAETATFLEAWALLELDRTEDARVALARYASRWPEGRHAATARAWLERFARKK